MSMKPLAPSDHLRRQGALRRPGHPLRVLHIGNIANNAYSIAKALRERAGIEADAFTHGYRHYISQPEWEDADIRPVRFSETEPPDWSQVDLNGFRRPEWYFEHLDAGVQQRLDRLPVKDMLRTVENRSLGCDGTREVGKLLRRFHRKGKPSELLGHLHQGLAVVGSRTLVGRQWHRHLVRQYRRLLDASFTPLREEDIHSFVKNSAGLASLFAGYDIIQTYGVWEPMWPLLLSPSIPRVTFEHGSMREHPFQNDALGRLLALSYKTSYRNIITNADAVHAMRRLGLTNCTYIPHPVDDEKFRPFDSPLRQRLLEENDCTGIVFAVARHNWAVKGNDKVIHGFALLKKRLGKGPKLFLADWGQEMEKSQDLVRQLKLEDDVVWLPPLPKRCLADYINASDVVLDQFVLGCFGTTTPEAMACGKPVILHYRPEDHQWCFPEHAPILNAYSAEEIAAALEGVLTDREQSRALGQRARDWFLRHHSLDLVVQRHVEIYRAIAASTSTVSVPKQRFVRTERNRKMAKGKVVALVRCSDPVDTRGDPKYLKKVGGVSLIESMSNRLQKIAHVSHVVLLLDQAEPQTATAARRLGWSVVLRNKRRWQDVAASWHLARCNSVALFNLQRPFVDPAIVDPLLDTVCNNGVATLRVTEGVEFTPSRVIKRNFAIRVFLLKAIMKRTSMSWRQAMEALSPFVGTAEQSVSVPSVARAFAADSCSDQMVEAVGGLDFGLDDVSAAASQPKLLAPILEEQRQALHRELACSSSPHVTNQQLNELECKLQSDELLSFPTYVGINLSTYCNVRCKFCSYHPSTMKHQSMLTLNQFRQMDWLKYVSRVSLFAGIGDSLVNPQFRDILQYARTTFPHLDVDFFTNGKGLTEPLVEDLISLKVNAIHCSLNAAKAETYDRLIDRGKFDHTVAMLRLLAKRKKELGASLPEIGISAVLVRENIDELPDVVRLAAGLDPKYVSTCHYATQTTVGHRRLDSSSSLYTHRELADRKFEEAKEVAKQLGVNLVLPAMFSEPHTIITGARIPKMPERPRCQEPWKSAYLTVDETGAPQFIFCCSGIYYGIYYSRDHLGEADFRKLWNHKIARYFRRTVNKFSENPLCAHCCTQDRFRPDDNLLEVEGQMQEIFADLQDAPQTECPYRKAG